MDDKRSKADLQLPVEENLLPGIPCEITRTMIFPKLFWRDRYTLSSVNRTWNYALRSRQVFDEPLRAHSTATFFPGYRTQKKIAFYSMGERSWYRLPPVPNVQGLDQSQFRIPFHCGCVSMNGKIYVLGGSIHPPGGQINSFETSNQVFVFDVAAGGKWEQCASMKEPRTNFARWMQDGKIYVFGGCRDVSMSLETPVTRPVIGGEVYDPDKNAWSPIKARQSYGDSVDNPFEGFESNLATFNASKDEWSVLSLPPESYLLFNAQGKTYSTQKDVWGAVPRHVFEGEFTYYDVHRNYWTHSHSFSFNGVLPNNYVIVYLRAILEVEDELLAIAEWSYRGFHKREHGHCLLQSRGFGNEKKEISWELRDLNFTLNGPDTSFEDSFHESGQYFTLKL